MRRGLPCPGLTWASVPRALPGGAGDEVQDTHELDVAVAVVQFGIDRSLAPNLSAPCATLKGVKYEDDPAEYARRLNAKLKPSHIRSTLAFAGLYQIVHEQIKRAVLDDVRDYYWNGIDVSGDIYDEPSYREQVLSRCPKNKFRASLLWLVNLDAITLAEADRLDDIYAHRHALSHELVKYIVDPAFDPDVESFAAIHRILIKPPSHSDITEFRQRLGFGSGYW